MAAPCARMMAGAPRAVCRVLWRSQQRSLSTGRGLLPRPRPLPVLLVTGGGYLGYHHYWKKDQSEDEAPRLATPTQLIG